MGSLIIFLLLLCPSLVSSTIRAPTTIVHTSLGSITGLVDESGRFASFFGSFNSQHAILFACFYIFMCSFCLFVCCLIDKCRC